MCTQDQNGALEMELGDVKGRVDEDVLEVRALQEQLAAKAKLEVRAPPVSLYNLGQYPDAPDPSVKDVVLTLVHRGWSRRCLKHRRPKYLMFVNVLTCA